jgi:hypothetical protein
MSGAWATPDSHASAHATAQSTHAPENLGPWPQPLHTHAFCVLCLAEIGTLNVDTNLNTYCQVTTCIYQNMDYGGWASPCGARRSCSASP